MTSRDLDPAMAGSFESMYEGTPPWDIGRPQREFVRLEDIAYDKRPGMQNVVYVVDSGRGATSAGGNAFTSTNGRVWKLVLDPSNPKRVISLSILIEGDDAPGARRQAHHQARPNSPVGRTARISAIGAKSVK